MSCINRILKRTVVIQIEIRFKCCKMKSPASAQHSQKEEASGCSHGHQQHSSKRQENNGISAQLQNNSKSDTQKTTTSTYTLWLINPQFKTTADCVYAEANQTVQHACRNKSQSIISN